jgi:hypothetical protein
LCPKFSSFFSQIDPIQIQNNDPHTTQKETITIKSDSETEPNKSITSQSPSLIYQQLERLLSICRLNKKNNPLLILRMFADIINTIKTKLSTHKSNKTLFLQNNTDNTKQIIEEAFEKYKIFVGDDEEEVFLETQIIQALKTLLLKRDPFLEDGMHSLSY